MKWKRPSGSEIETNDAESTIDSCMAMGWEPLEVEDWGSSEPGEEVPPEPEATEQPRKRKRGK